MVEEISKLPPSAMVVFAMALAVLFAIRYFGFKIGVESPPKSPASAQVAAVIVDPTALNMATAAVEALNMTLIEYNMLLRKKLEIEEETKEVLQKLRDEIYFYRELNRSR
jgi:hypothetical protein